MSSVVVFVVCVLLIVAHRVSFLVCCLLFGVSCFVCAAVLPNTLFEVRCLLLVVCRCVVRGYCCSSLAAACCLLVGGFFA